MLLVDSVRDNWDELPEPSKAQLSSMRMAIHFLPSFLAGAAPMDDELIDFTQNHGWHKIDKLLPSALGVIFANWENSSIWLRFFARATDDLKVGTFPLPPGLN